MSKFLTPGPCAHRLIALLAMALCITAVPATAQGLPPFDANTSLLVVSPHPDDETLCCAGAMQRVAAAGGKVSVVWITSGDGSILSMLLVEKSLFTSRAKARDLALRRMREARAATSLLGVPGAQQLFLGYPDGGLLKLLTVDRATPERGKLTGERRVPYSEALFPGHPYTGENLRRDFAAVLDQVRPTLILAPSPRDTHPDHRAGGLLAASILASRGESSKLHYWIVHGGEGWPSPRISMPSIPLTIPPSGAGLAWSEFVLNEREIARKHEAVSAYQTQMRVMSPFLLAFVRTSELYSAQSGNPGPTPTIQHPVQRAGDALLQSIQPRTLRPVAAAEHLGLRAIAFEYGGGHSGECCVLNLLVGLQVPLEAPAVEIAGAD
jgi:LmbE family N-acetylglucosaminyl deacetylase